MNKIWTAMEKQFIRENAKVLTDKIGAAKLSQITGRNISIHSYRKQRQLMKLSKKPGRGICALRGVDEG